jgi:hypothetical protein
MPSLRRKSHVSPWPLWLLVLAWFCANCPQTLLCTAVVWFGEAGSFSHQQRLTSSVAHLLVGEKPHSLLAHVRSILPAPAKPTLPALPALKKIELAAEDTVRWFAPLSPYKLRLPVPQHAESALRAPPLHGPPRAAAVS